MKTLMILGASILQLSAIKKALSMGLNVVVADKDPDAVGFKEEGLIKEVISTTDIPAVIDAAKKYKIDGIMTLASDMPMNTVAAVADIMGLPAVSPETALKATNKADMRRALSKNGVPIPEFYTVLDKNGYLEAVKHFEKSFIVKPADSSGSRGIFRIENPADTEAVENAYEYSRRQSRCGKVLVEEFMQGPEVSVETLSVDGECHIVQITDKITNGAPHYVELGHSQPTSLGDRTAEEIRNVTKAAVRALGIENGPSHTEIIVTEEGPKIVEVGARLGGDCITTHLVPLSTGVDMVECCIRIALGEKFEIKPTFSCGSAIRYFDQHAGRVLKIDGLADARNVAGVKHVVVVHGVESTVTDIVDSGSRMGFVIAQGRDAAEASAICDSALGKIKIEIGN